mmetsp:Transcript_7884/g.13219  ORF Transcript_7884/g.13219 Transcript_7884/m.13219 type:complete len:657 (-) Transcript_7884:705-2675(-)
MNKFFNTIRSEIKAVVTGTQLIKNYEVDKEPFMQAGLHQLWSVFRAKRRGRENQEVSIFMIEKRTWDKKKSESNLLGGLAPPSMREDAFNVLKRDPANLMKLRHPSILNLIEQPLEDDKYLVFVTEPVEFSLACLAEANSPYKQHLKEKIPSVLEIKQQALELMEALNFMHQNAKCVHGGLAPETIFVTREGKIKIAGLNFCTPLGTEDQAPIHVSASVKFNEFFMYPNLKFQPQEVSSEPARCSPHSDLFSIGCLVFFLLQLEKGKDPFVLGFYERSNPQSHKQDVASIALKVSSKLAGLDQQVQEMLRQILGAAQANQRGSLSSLVTQNPWFQDPLLKTLRYLENIDYKEQAQKVQFLGGLQKVLDQFEKKIKVEKILPLLMQSLEKDTQLSVHVIPIIIQQLGLEGAMTPSQFRERIWPSIVRLCQQKELPAQSIYLLLKNQELILKFISQQEFSQVFLPLITKSLACGVPKLQVLALNKVKTIFQQMDYQVVKSQIIPRVLQILETAQQLDLKMEVFATVRVIMKGIDAYTLKNDVMKSMERVRQKETDPRLCMKMLEIYEEIGKILGPDEIGVKILPGIIPMLISGQFSKGEFKDLMGSVRRLLDQIEAHRLPSLPENSTLGSLPSQSASPSPALDMFGEPSSASQSPQQP